MSMKNLFILFALFLTCDLSYGQVNSQNKSEVVNDPRYIEFKKRHDDLVNKQSSKTTVSNYYGYEETLRSYLINESIPASVPKAESSASKEAYVKQLNSWLTNNKQFLKPEHQNSLIKE